MNRLHLVYLALLLGTAFAALAQPADNWPRKKLIETGWDQPDTARPGVNRSPRRRPRLGVADRVCTP